MHFTYFYNVNLLLFMDCVNTAIFILVPAQPELVNQTSSYDSISVAWRTVVGADIYSVAVRGFSLTRWINVTSAFVEQKNLQSGKVYNFSITAINRAGQGKQLQLSTATGKPIIILSK